MIAMICVGSAYTKVAIADVDTPQKKKGVCEAVVPGWLRGVADGYNGFPDRTVQGGLGVIPVPAELASEDSIAGYRYGLTGGYAYGLDFGKRLADQARAAEPAGDDEMSRDQLELKNLLDRYCEVPQSLEWSAIPLNPDGSTTAASLHDAQLAMAWAVQANIAAAGAEKAARAVREAEAKGDQASAAILRASAQSIAGYAATSAQTAGTYAATGREEATQAIIDAQAAAARAKKAAESVAGDAPR